ncbi:hypothetical protein EK904_013612 [Melospiza melodia maxima]|nr:hypothetical protein EK904_013612 [Melospiza melodia maxima]
MLLAWLGSCSALELDLKGETWQYTMEGAWSQDCGRPLPSVRRGSWRRGHRITFSGLRATKGSKEASKEHHSFSSTSAVGLEKAAAVLMWGSHLRLCREKVPSSAAAVASSVMCWVPAFMCPKRIGWWAQIEDRFMWWLSLHCIWWLLKDRWGQMVLICCVFCINTEIASSQGCVSFLGPAGRRSFFTETWKTETWQLHSRVHRDILVTVWGQLGKPPSPRKLPAVSCACCHGPGLQIPVCCRDAIFPGDALTCGISPDTAAPKQFLYPQFRKGHGLHIPCKKASDISGEQRSHPATAVPMLHVSSAGDMHPSHHSSPR